jgi:hypothetical protein
MLLRSRVPQTVALCFTQAGLDIHSVRCRLLTRHRPCCQNPNGLKSEGLPANLPRCGETRGSSNHRVMAVAAEIARHAHKTPALAYPRGALPGQRTQPCGPREQQCTGFADTRLHRLNSIDSRHSAESLPLAHHRLNGLLTQRVGG